MFLIGNFCDRPDQIRSAGLKKFPRKEIPLDKIGPKEVDFGVGIDLPVKEEMEKERDFRRRVMGLIERIMAEPSFTTMLIGTEAGQGQGLFSQDDRGR